MVGPAHGGLAADAAAHLARSGHTVEGFRRSPEEIDRQAACLIEWARRRNALLAGDYISGLKKHESTTAEHEVFYRESVSRTVQGKADLFAAMRPPWVTLEG